MGFFDKLFGGKTEQEETVKFFGQSKTVLTPIRGKVLATVSYTHLDVYKRQTSFRANGDQHTRAVELSTYFCVLTIRKQLPRNGFERSGRGQEPSRGHKFSILENVVLHWDFTSAMRLHCRSDLVGACLPQTLLIIRALRHEWNGVSCFT